MSAGAQQEHSRALQALYPEVEKYRHLKDVEGLLWYFSGYDQLGNPNQYFDFLLRDIRYDDGKMQFSASLKSLGRYEWENKTDTDQFQKFTRTDCALRETVFTFGAGFGIGMKQSISSRSEVAVKVPVVRYIKDKAELDYGVWPLAEFSFQDSQTVLDTDTESVTLYEEVKVPAKTRVSADVLQSQGTFSGPFDATFECVFTDLGLQRWGRPLAEMVPDAKLQLHTLGQVAGLDNLDILVKTQQSPIAADLSEAA